MTKIKLNKVAPTKRYRVRELAEKLGITSRALYYKIKDDLPVITMKGTFYIVGNEFIEYEKGKREQRKKGSLKPNEFYCVHCDSKRKPLNGQVEVYDFSNSDKKVRKGSILLKATCPICKKKMNRFGSQKDKEKFLEAAATD